MDDDEESKYYSVEDDSDEDKESFVVYDKKSRNKEIGSKTLDNCAANSGGLDKDFHLIESITVEAVKKKLINDP